MARRDAHRGLQRLRNLSHDVHAGRRGAELRIDMEIKFDERDWPA